MYIPSTQLWQAMKLVRVTLQDQRSSGERVWGEGLMGACGLASFLLAHLLPPSLEPRLVVGKFYGKSLEQYATTRWNNHCWVRTSTYVLDVTATQFMEYASTPYVILPARAARKQYTRETYSGVAAFAHLRTWGVEGYSPTTLEKLRARMRSWGYTQFTEMPTLASNAWENRYLFFGDAGSGCNCTVCLSKTHFETMAQLQARLRKAA